MELSALGTKLIVQASGIDSCYIATTNSIHPGLRCSPLYIPVEKAWLADMPDGFLAFIHIELYTVYSIHTRQQAHREPATKIHNNNPSTRHSYSKQ